MLDTSNKARDAITLLNSTGMLILNYCNLVQLQEPDPACLGQKGLLPFLLLFQNNTTQLSDFFYLVIRCCFVLRFHCSLEETCAGNQNVWCCLSDIVLYLLMFQAYISSMLVAFLLCRSRSSPIISKKNHLEN